MTAPTTSLGAVDVLDASAEQDDAPIVDTALPPAPKPAHTRASSKVLRRGVTIFLFAVVAFVVFAVVLSGLVQARTQIGLQRRFSNELSSERAPIGGVIPAGAPVAVLQINAIGLDQVVVEGSRSTQLQAGPGHVVGSSLPGQPGNAVLAGRRTLYGGAFKRLGSLRPGNRIRVTTGQGVAHYVVSDVARLAAGDGSFVQDHGDNRLTLFTSDSSWNPDGRLVVTATLKGAPFGATALQPLDTDALGLTGDRGATPNLLVWLELLAGAALLVAYLSTRWSRSRTWLVGAPVLALLTWMFFESVVRLLPATL